MRYNANMTLVINCGSSSLKFAVFEAAARAPSLSGLAECLGEPEARITYKNGGAPRTLPLGPNGHGSALDTLIDILDDHHKLEPVRAVGHRVVHGGERFKQSALITPSVLTDIESCNGLAPLHNPANVLGIRTALEKLPTVPQVAVFDTAFHQTMPPEAYLYGLPQTYYRDFGIRRYGFHGSSHRYVAEETLNVLGLDPADHGLVIAHLGNGASATAVLNGQSVDTTMGMTPLEGLIMGTRCGDVDAGAVAFLAREAGLNPKEMDAVLNKRSGLLGLSELSNDCRILEAAAKDGHEGAMLALKVFAHRLARHIGGLSMSLPRLDAVVFTGGIGENSAMIRSMTMQRLRPLGVELDEAANRAMVRGQSGLISRRRAPAALVLPTNEEWMIARDTEALTCAGSC
ncbi:MAG TPA: acetate kinase [Candidatus Sulfotelmatobacter sp.]|jgi:acetate kinase|nr:acetate kinase [Candidatus Sulfotelmatobacter sp.]